MQMYEYDHYVSVDIPRVLNITAIYIHIMSDTIIGINL